MHFFRLRGFVEVIVVIGVPCHAVAMVAPDNLRCRVFLCQEDTTSDDLVAFIVVVMAVVDFTDGDLRLEVFFALFAAITNFKPVLAHLRIVVRVFHLVLHRDAPQIVVFFIGLAGLR